MKDEKDYRNRIADQLLKEQLEAAGAVLIQGGIFVVPITCLKP